MRATHRRKLMALVTTVAVLAAALATLAVRAAISDAAGVTYFVAVGGSGTTCSSALPCGTFDAAYQKAAAGDFVEVRAGSYGDQQFAPRALAGTNVTVRPAAGAAVTVGKLDIYGPHVTVTGGMTIADVAFGQPGANFPYPGQPSADGSMLDGVNVRQGVQTFGGTTNLTVKRSKIVGDYDNDRFSIFGGSNITLDGNIAGAAYLPAGSVQHVDCLQIAAGTTIIVRNNRLFGCAAETIIVKPDLGAIDNVRFENNFIQDCVVPVTSSTGPSCNAVFAIQFFTGVTNVSFVHNSVEGVVGVRANSGVTMIGNIIRQLEPSDANGTLNGAACSTVTIERNLIGSHRCTTLPASNIVGLATYVGPINTVPDPNTGPNLHLKTTSLGINVGSSVAPATDIDGDARVPATADLGADEVVTSTTTTTTSTTTTAPPKKRIAYVLSTNRLGLTLDQPLIDHLQAMTDRTVTVVDPTAIPAGGLTGYNLIVVSTNADASAVARKLNSSTTPILTWNSLYYGTLWLAIGTGSQSNQTRLQITNFTHPATVGLGGSSDLPTVVYGAAASMPFGSPPASAVKLARIATSSTRWALFAVQPGGRLIDASVAPGCRIAFPAPRNTADLNATGLKLFDQTANWALGGCK